MKNVRFHWKRSKLRPNWLNAAFAPGSEPCLWMIRKWLIVIASPATPQSEWVRKEINLFQKTWGRADKVLALLVQGTPDMSFPPELRRLVTTGEGTDTITELIDPAGASVVASQDKTEIE